MKNKIIGLIVIVISLISYGINISLAYISMYLYGLNTKQAIDTLEITNFINTPVSIITIISVLIGIYIMFSTDEKSMFKRIRESMKKWNEKLNDM